MGSHKNWYLPPSPRITTLISSDLLMVQAVIVLLKIETGGGCNYQKFKEKGEHRKRRDEEKKNEKDLSGFGFKVLFSLFTVIRTQNKRT